jgi:hypothetical protein
MVVSKSAARCFITQKIKKRGSITFMCLIWNKILGRFSASYKKI